MPHSQYITDCPKCNAKATVIRRSAWNETAIDLKLTDSSLCLACGLRHLDTTYTVTDYALTTARQKAGFNPRTKRFEAKG